MGDFKYKHSLGQNFLKDKSVLIKIIDSVEVKENDLIIEIGPGHGALTKYLKLFHANLICFEIDTRVKSYLEKYEDNKTKIVYKDFMQVNLSEELENYEYENVYVIANIPYYITTPIITKFVESGIKIKEMVFMVQNEVADRLTAKVGTREYGAISVLLGYYYDINKLFVVSRKCFEPVPNVDSAVIKFSSKNDMFMLKDYGKFEKLVQDAFFMKRKNLKNNLKKYDLEKVTKVLEQYNLDLTNRAEQVPVECFVEISNIL